MGDEALVDVVELLDQGLDAVVVQRQRLHRRDDIRLELLVLALLGRGQLLVLHALFHMLDLQAAQLLVVVGDGVEGFEHARLQLGLHGRERHVVLHVVVVELALGRGHALLGLGRLFFGLALGETVHLRRALAVGAGVGGLEVDDVAQKHPAFDELVAPDDDGLEGQRAFAQARDHRLAAGLDALGDRDLALAGEKLHRAHLAQVHAHRIVGAVGRLLGRRLADDDGAGLRGLDEVAAVGFLLVGLGLSVLVRLLGLDHVDAHLGELAEHVLDLLRVELLGRQNLVQLIIGDIAALLRELDHPLDGGIAQVEQRPVGLLLGRRRIAFVAAGCLRCHALLNSSASPIPPTGPAMREWAASLEGSTTRNSFRL